MNVPWAKHRKICRILVVLGCLCLLVWSGRAIFQHEAKKTRFSGTLIGQYGGLYWPQDLPPCFVAKDPNHLENETAIGFSETLPREYRMRASALTDEGLYFVLTVWKPSKDLPLPAIRIMCLTEDGLQEIPIIWQNEMSNLSFERLYVYTDKFYLAFRSGFNSEIHRIPDKVYSIPKEGGLAKELPVDLNLWGFGDSTGQRAGTPIQYKDGLICIRWGDPVVVFINDEGEKPLFHLPIGTAKLLKGWYEEDKNLLLWSSDPDYAIVVNLQGDVLFELYRSWFISSTCWDVYGNAANGILFSESSVVGHTYFPGFYAMDFLRKERVWHFDTGIYDTRTGNMIPLYWKGWIDPVCWSKVDYDEDFFEKLAAAAKRTNLRAVINGEQ